MTPHERTTNPGTPICPDLSSLTACLTELNININQEQYQTLCHYTRLVAEWNKKINLISRPDTPRIFTYHIIDSLTTSPFIPANARCADLGTGAGLPGIPLAVTRPDIFMILIESTRKKCLFLNSALNQLQLRNALLLCARAEELSPLGCDIILSRLTAPLSKTLKFASPHSKPGGTLILYKSARWKNEINEEKNLLNRYNFLLRDSATIKLPFSGIERHLIFLNKISR